MEPQRLPVNSDEDALDEYALDLLDQLTDPKPSAKRSADQPEQKEGEEKKARCRCPKWFSRQDLKILAAALTSALSVSLVIIIGFCCSRKGKSGRPNKGEDPEQAAEMKVTSL